MTDFLNECFDSIRPQLSQMQEGDKVTVDQFKAQVCATCCAPDCTRSRLSASSFQDRVTNWRERLFTNPIKLDPRDPRFPVFQSQAFKDVPIIGRGSSKQVAVSAWLDPLQDNQQPEVHTPPKRVEPAKVQPVVEQSKIVEVPTASVAVPADLDTVSNTPFQHGTTLPGAPEKTTERASEADPWGGPLPPAPLSTDENPAVVLKPGGKFRFGGGV